MGWWINRLRTLVEAGAGDSPWKLRLGGALISLALLGGSAMAGWALEQLAWQRPLLGLPVLVVALASALAGGSLDRAVRGVLTALGPGPDPTEADLVRARARLDWIVGRDVEGLPGPEILRAAAETAAENAVDGLFGPLFWMLLGAAQLGWTGVADGAVGPLALAWSYKAASTLDSMLGYRCGRLRWLGTAGARLDDLLTWLPCRLVAFSLPLLAGFVRRGPSLALLALRQGRADPSPNAGVSQAAYALAVEARLGGVNRYAGIERTKPVLGEGFPPADAAAVERILSLSGRLEQLWLGLSLPLIVLLSLI